MVGRMVQNWKNYIHQFIDSHSPSLFPFTKITVHVQDGQINFVQVQIQLFLIAQNTGFPISGTGS